MLVSLFTPTHDPRYLAETHASLCRQTHSDWEWVLLPNGPARTADIPAAVRADSRVRVVAGPESGRIGDLKKSACDECSGEVFVELDHDDLLPPNALERVRAATENGAGFIYSDAAVFFQKPKPDRSVSYHPSHGWAGYPFRVYGQTFIASQAFPVSPRSLCEIYYAPDHIRAWSREAYQAVGGHDTSMRVGDDHDLMCRTYLAGYPFAHAGGCCYLYRKHPENTVRHQAGGIQRQVRNNRVRHTRPLIREWCRRHRLPQIELPRGPLPACAQNSVGHIHLEGVVGESRTEQVEELMNAAYDALVPGGYVTVTEPEEVRVKPLRRFTERAHAGRGTRCRYQWIQNYAQDGRRYLDLVALKGQRHPGPQKI